MLCFKRIFVLFFVVRCCFKRYDEGVAVMKKSAWAKRGTSVFLAALMILHPAGSVLGSSDVNDLIFDELPGTEIVETTDNPEWFDEDQSDLSDGFLFDDGGFVFEDEEEESAALNWQIIETDEDCILILSGEEALDKSAQDQPWAEEAYRITRILIGKEITRIGTDGLAGYDFLRTIEFEEAAPILEEDCFKDLKAEILYFHDFTWEPYEGLSFGGEVVWIDQSAAAEEAPAEVVEAAEPAEQDAAEEPVSEEAVIEEAGTEETVPAEDAEPAAEAAELFEEAEPEEAELSEEAEPEETVTEVPSEEPAEEEPAPEEEAAPALVEETTEAVEEPAEEDAAVPAEEPAQDETAEPAEADEVVEPVEEAAETEAVEPAAEAAEAEIFEPAEEAEEAEVVEPAEEAEETEIAEPAEEAEEAEVVEPVEEAAEDEDPELTEETEAVLVEEPAEEPQAAEAGPEEILFEDVAEEAEEALTEASEAQPEEAVEVSETPDEEPAEALFEDAPEEIPEFAEEEVTEAAAEPIETPEEAVQPVEEPEAAVEEPVEAEEPAEEEPAQPVEEAAEPETEIPADELIIDDPAEEPAAEEAEAPADESAETEELFTDEDPSLLAVSSTSAPKITKQPVSQAVATGTSVTFSVTAIGVGELSYLWQYSKDGGKTWNNSSTRKATYTITVSKTQDTFQYRCIVTDGNGHSTTSQAAALTLTDNPLKITKQPTAMQGKVGATVSTSVTASGSGLTYQWQYSKNGGASWTNASNKTATYSLKISTGNYNFSYRCKVSDSKGGTIISNEVPLTILPAITVQPAAVSTTVGKSASFSVTATGVDLTYLWQYSKDGGASWVNTSNKTNTYTITVAAAHNLFQYRCVVTDGDGHTATSQAAVLTLTDALKITKQPTAMQGSIGDKVSTSVAASGTGLTYQWQFSKDGGSTWTNASNKTPTYTLTIAAGNYNFRYRCKVTDGSGKSVTSSAVALTILPKFTTQPVSASALAGNSVSFTAKASGVGVTLQWQYSKNSGSTWTNTSAKNNQTYTITAALANNNFQYRCIATDSDGHTAISDVASLKVVDGILITKQPESLSVAIGATAKFETAAISKTTVSYQWQFSKDGGSTWNNSTKAATYSVTAAAVHNGFRYRCIVTDTAGHTATTNAAILKIAAAITKQPANQNLQIGATSNFNITATGVGLTYLWQFSKDGGKTWTNTSNKTNTYKGPVGAAQNKFQYRCMVKDSNGNTVISDPGILTVLPKIVTQPTAKAAAIGNSVSFTVAAEGVGITYQWQSSTNGSTWTPVANAVSATYTFTVAQQHEGFRFRCQVSDANGKVLNSSAAALTVLPEGCFAYGGIIYINLSNGTVGVWEYKGTAANVVIPETVQGKTVTEICEAAFENNKTLQSITLPGTIQYIRKRAFANCTSLSTMNS